MQIVKAITTEKKVKKKKKVSVAVKKVLTNSNTKHKNTYGRNLISASDYIQGKIDELLPVIHKDVHNILEVETVVEYKEFSGGVRIVLRNKAVLEITFGNKVHHYKYTQGKNVLFDHKA